MRNLGNIAQASNAETVPWYSQLLQSLTQVGTAYLSFEQQRELLRINADRARQNLPPLTVSQYAPGVQVGVDQSTQNTAKLIAFAGIGAILVYAVTSAMTSGSARGRRR